jgi:hypothetical protein
MLPTGWVVVIIVVGLPFLEDGTDTPTGQP